MCGNDVLCVVLYDSMSCIDRYLCLQEAEEENNGDGVEETLAMVEDSEPVDGSNDVVADTSMFKRVCMCERMCVCLRESV